MKKEIHFHCDLYNQELDRTQLKVDFINQVIKETEILCRIKIRNKKSFLENPIDYVMFQIGENHPEVKLLGLSNSKIVEMFEYNLTPLENGLKKIDSMKGDLKVVENLIKPFADRSIYCVYTTNEVQEKALEQAEELSGMMNKLSDEGFDFKKYGPVGQVIPGVMFNSAEDKYQPNYHNISRL